MINLGLVGDEEGQLTLAEAVHVNTCVRQAIEQSDAGGDAVLESAYAKIHSDAVDFSNANPGAYEEIQAQVEMQQRFKRPQ